MAKQLTDKQKKFISTLFTEAGGDFVRAKHLAGYSENTATFDIVESLREEIAEATRAFIKDSAAKAAYSMYQVLDDPTALGNKERIAAAKDLLDRAGHKPTDKVEVSAHNPIFILPEKK
jgi:hypothetical protein